jgi:ParB/Sulfiredoxin domain
MRMMRWSLDEIVIAARMRDRLREDAVASLMESIQKIGLREPPTIRIEHDEDEDGGEYPILVSGLHRIEALRRLGAQYADCAVFDGDETEARLWEISENLHRAELTPDERDEHIREWFKLTGQKDKKEEDGQENKLAAGGQFLLSERVGGRGNDGGVREFTREFNLPRTTVQEALELGKLDPTVKEQAEASGLNRKDKLKVVRTVGEDPEQQTAMVRKIAEKKFIVAPSEAQMFAELLMSRLTHSEILQVISWLEGCKPKDVIAAMRTAAA